MSEFVQSYQVVPGTAGSEATPPDTDALYVSSEELTALYGCAFTEADIRAAMSIIHSVTCRPSLWVTEYEHMVRVPTDRQETRLPVTPVTALHDLAGRYSYGRRDRMGWQQQSAGYSALLLLSGAKPAWSPIDPRACEFDSATGIVYLPYSFYMVPWNLIRCRYSAGLITIPPRIKLSIFELCNNFHAKGVSDRLRYSAGRVSRQYASDSFVTPQAKSLLEPFIVRSLF